MDVRIIRSMAVGLPTTHQTNTKTPDPQRNDCERRILSPRAESRGSQELQNKRKNDKDGKRERREDEVKGGCRPVLKSSHLPSAVSFFIFAEHEPWITSRHSSLLVVLRQGIFTPVDCVGWWESIFPPDATEYFDPVHELLLAVFVDSLLG